VYKREREREEIFPFIEREREGEYIHTIEETPPNRRRNFKVINHNRKSTTTIIC